MAGRHHFPRFDSLRELLGLRARSSGAGTRDIGTVYHLLRRQGLSQRKIAHFTGQSQSEVSEILHGRQVVNVWVLERIAEGLGIPRSWMGLGYGDQTSDTPPAEEMSEAMKRRVLVLTTLTGATGKAFGGLPTLALPSTPALPTRLEMLHVYTVRALRCCRGALHPVDGGPRPQGGYHSAGRCAGRAAHRDGLVSL